MKIQQQDGCQAADTLGDLNNELTPRPCDSRAGHFEELFSGPCFLFVSVWSQKEGGREGRRAGVRELSYSNEIIKRWKWSGSKHQ